MLIAQVPAYLGRDFPREWPLEVGTVQMSFDADSVHYGVFSDTAAQEWRSLLPSGGAVVRLGPDMQPYTVSMFHQLRCLDVIREGIVAYHTGDTNGPSAILTKHCMNYMRQMILCRSSTRLENIRDISTRRHRVTNSGITYTCRDWNAVLEAAEENWSRFAEKIDAEGNPSGGL